MTALIPPVQALQHEIDVVREAHECLLEIDPEMANDNRSLAIRLAALELAKAMCEVPPHLLNCDARVKLAELLKVLQE